MGKDTFVVNICIGYSWLTEHAGMLKSDITIIFKQASLIDEPFQINLYESYEYDQLQITMPWKYSDLQ